MTQQSLSLANKYRPKYFRHVVGQDIFVSIMRNMIKRGCAGHGFLLTGIQGVGKTTLARLMAKALSCAHIQDEQEPCGQCNSCEALQCGKHMDVLEIDAASHTSIDDIRQILDSCYYSTLMGPFKIFIIDEVHMLSKSAFNALLKTLEEPPPHVKFILATTEISKVPLTIASRCQQMHLRRVPLSLLIAHLRTICAQENIAIEDDALALLARYADGSVRDGLSLLERAMLVTDAVLSLSCVQAVLGIPDQREVQSLLDLILEKDVDKVLNKMTSLYESGLEPSSILGELMVIIGERMCASQDVALLACLDRLWQITQKAFLEETPFPMITLKIALLRMVYMGHFPTPGQLLREIEGALPEKPSLSGQKQIPAAPVKSRMDDEPPTRSLSKSSLVPEPLTSPSLTSAVQISSAKSLHTDESHPLVCHMRTLFPDMVLEDTPGANLTQGNA